MIQAWLDYSQKSLATCADFGAELEFYFDGDIEALKSRFAKMQITSEDGEQQYELQTEVFTNPLELIEEINRCKQQISLYSKSQSSSVSFDAKPYLDRPGSAMHFHIKVENHLREKEILSFAIGGLCNFMLNSMGSFAPNPESYKRFLYPNIHTPTTVSWGNKNNRSVAIRQLSSNMMEHRVPGADCNLFGTVYAIIQSITIGIALELSPPLPSYGLANTNTFNGISFATLGYNKEYLMPLDQAPETAIDFFSSLKTK